MEIKQEHNSNGDNIAGNKFENNYYSNTENSAITSKIAKLQSYKEMDFSDDIVIEAFKETVVDLIKEEQGKSHNIVPIGHIRNFYKNGIQDDIFETVIKSLNSEKAIEINNVQVCYIPKDLTYRIEI